MAVFNLASVGDVSSAEDLKQVKDYLFKLQEQLKYMFANLDPDDNYASSVPKLVVAKGTDSGAKIEVSVDGITMSVGGVSEEGLIDTINTQIQLTGKCINLSTGHITINATNFTLDSNGNATFSGAMTAGTINIGSGNFQVDANGNVTAKSIDINTMGSGKTGYFGSLVASGLGCGNLSVTYNVVSNLNMGSGYDIYPAGSWWQGWGIAQTIQYYHSS